MSERRHIFLSYRSTEADFALKLAADLKNAGVNLWMDRLDIKPGDDWRRSLERAVYSCAALISVLSPAYVSSKYCQRELARADRLSRPIFPVLLGTIAEADWPLEIERQQYIDFSNWEDKEAYQEQLARLVNILKEKFAAQISVIPDPETQYLTNMAAAMETQKGLAEYLEFSTEAEKWVNREMIRPEPHSIKFWTSHTTFTLLQPSSIDGHFHKRLFTEIDEILEKHPRVVLTGGPGSGKTTTLLRLALDAIYTHQAATEKPPLPLLLDLVTWDDHVSLDHFIRSNWRLDTDPIKLMARGDIILFLDGLNEMTGAYTRKIEMLRAWIESENGPKRVIVTCRTADYNETLNLHLPRVQINDMDRPHIEEFAINYLGEELSQIFLTQILPRHPWDEQHKQYLLQLARNPFLLSALILIHKSSAYGEVPENLGILLRRLVAEIWEREHPQPGMPATSFEELEMALSDLAYAMIEDETGIYVPYNFALENMGSEALLKAARQTGFVEIRASMVRFSQQVLQDYFAALVLSRTDPDSRIPLPQIGSGGEYIPGRWDRSVVIYSGLAYNTDETLLGIARTNPFLALECIASGINASDHTVEPIIGKLIHMGNTPENDARVATASILAHINQEMALPILMQAMREGRWDVRWAATLALQDMDVPLLPGLTDTLWELEHDIQDATDSAIRYLGPSALPTLLKLLNSDNWKMRRSAAWALGRVRDEAAVPGLVQALHDEDNLVGAEAAISLGYIKDNSAIPWLSDTLRHANWRVRRAAAQSLSAIGSLAIEPLLQVLEDAEDDVRRLAIDALKEINDAAIDDILLDTTHDPNAEVRAAAIDALRGREDSRIVHRLIECLSDQTRIKWNRKRICDIAAQVLDTFHAPEARAAMEQWQKDEGDFQLAPKQKAVPTKSPLSKETASTARDRLMRIKQTTDADAPHAQALEATYDEDWQKRRDAVVSLRQVNVPIVTLRLMGLLEDEQPEVRLAAVETLATINDSQAHETLIKALRDNNVEVAKAAAASLKAIGQPVIPLLAKLLSDPALIVRARVIDLLGKIGDSAALAHLTPLLASTDQMLLNGTSIRDMAASAIKAINAAQPGAPSPAPATTPPPPAPAPVAADVPENQPEKPAPVPAPDEPTAVGQRRDILSELLAALHGSDWGDREDAAKALREYARTLHGTRDEHIVKLLTEALRDQDWVVRWAAAEALAWVGDPASIPMLIKALDDRYWMVRIAVIRALLEIGDSSAAQSLSKLLSDRHGAVREAAAEALGALGDPGSVTYLSIALSDKEPLVRLASTVALGQISSNTVIQPLLKAVNDEDSHTRWAAVQALGQVAGAEAVPELIKRLGDEQGPYWEDDKICDLAAEALLRIGTPDAQSAVQKWKAQQVTTDQ